MTINDIISTFSSHTDEKQHTHQFWNAIIADVLGGKTDTDHVRFEEPVSLDNGHNGYIDVYLPKTRVLIEQKSGDINLFAPQSGHNGMTPYEQAKSYDNGLPQSKKARWIVTSNFHQIVVYDMEKAKPAADPFIINLADLEKNINNLRFLVDDGSAEMRHEMEVSIKAGRLVGLLYDEFLKQYGDNPTRDDLHSLNVLCVRLVFCLYAEDAEVFAKDQFHDYLATFKPENMRMALRDLFAVLDTPVEKRDKFLEKKLADFPYVNGSLFRQREGESIPPVTDETASLLLDHASSKFDWSDISPTIFGAVFESTLNPETRRSGGMHYTSIENIHKVIDPLFMDNLRDRFSTIKVMPRGKQKTNALKAMQNDMANLRFLDPACGSGNFLTETFMSLRRLENDIIEQMTDGQSFLGFEEVNPVKVSIQQMYGIEINDFAVTVASTALWIAESQMLRETEKIIRFNNDFLPLKPYNNIREANALRIDWNEVIKAEELDYIVGNPPFVGYSLQSASQKEDMLSIFVDEKGKPYKTAGKIDYVSAWYWKTSELMQKNANIHAALVSTNSITQGEQVAAVWKPIMTRFGIHIDFAWRTFRWDSESALKAHVHCVIVGFSADKTKDKRRLFNEKGEETLCDNINGYLTNAKDIFVENNNKNICSMPQMLSGNRPSDGGYLLLTKDEKETLVTEEPLSSQFIKKFMMGEEFINRIPRYCLWLVKATPADLRKMPRVMERVTNCKNERLASSDKGRVRLADTPHLFREQINPSCFIAVPKVSSERRLYVPIGYLDDETIAGDKLFMIPDAKLYHFGILTSSVHMDWMRAVCGRLKSDYSYSINIVYNNFPWPEPTEAQKQKIEQTAQAILDARAIYPDSSLADLYDEVTMPAELRKAHRQNDQAVLAAYGLKTDMPEEDIVAYLMDRYQQLTTKES